MANVNITGLTAIAALATADLVEVVDDPAGTPLSRKATVQQVLDSLGTTKGDLYVHNGTALVRVGVGADGGLLEADSAEASGVKWSATGAYATPADLTVIDANVQTASYTLVIGDAGKAVEMNVASANNLTVPPNSTVAFPVGTVVEVCQVGAGVTTVVAGAGVTINTPETLVLSGQWSTVSLRKRGTDLWVLAGDVEPAA